MLASELIYVCLPCQEKPWHTDTHEIERQWVSLEMPHRSKSNNSWREFKKYTKYELYTIINNKNNDLHHGELGLHRKKQKNKTHISNCWQMKIITLDIWAHYHIQWVSHKHTDVHTPGLTEPLPKRWSLLVPPPPEPDLNSSLWPTCLFTQRPHISLRHKGEGQSVTPSVILWWAKTDKQK